MNAIEIETILEKHFPQEYLGIYSANNYIPPSQPGEFSVVNTKCWPCSSVELLGHWFVLYQAEGTLEFFDSLGMHPQFYKFPHKPLLYSTVRLQSLDADTCGHYCVCYCIYRALGMPMSQFINLFDADDTRENDRLVRDTCALFL